MLWVILFVVVYRRRFPRHGVRLNSIVLINPQIVIDVVLYLRFVGKAFFKKWHTAQRKRIKKLAQKNPDKLWASLRQRQKGRSSIRKAEEKTANEVEVMHIFKKMLLFCSAM